MAYLDKLGVDLHDLQVCIWKRVLVAYDPIKVVVGEEVLEKSAKEVGYPLLDEKVYGIKDFLNLLQIEALAVDHDVIKELDQVLLVMVLVVYGDVDHLQVIEEVLGSKRGFDRVEQYHH